MVVCFLSTLAAACVPAIRPVSLRYQSIWWQRSDPPQSAWSLLSRQEASALGQYSLKPASRTTSSSLDCHFVTKKQGQSSESSATCNFCPGWTGIESRSHQCLFRLCWSWGTLWSQTDRLGSKLCKGQSPLFTVPYASLLRLLKINS